MVLNGKCVTVVASAGLHFRAFYLLTFAASHDLKETIDKDYCECGIPLETFRESETPKSKGTTLKLGVRLKHVRFVPLTVLLIL